ncbi:MAG: hypothetical protein ACXVZR_14705, partial [Terriglobales bacterium]
MTAIAPDLSRKTAWAWLVATFFGIGRLNPGPGTWASVATVLLWRALAPLTRVVATAGEVANLPLDRG